MVEKTARITDTAFSLLNNLAAIGAVLCFAIGFAVFISSIVRLFEANSPVVSLLIGAGLMIVPIVLGVWRLEFVIKKFVYDMARLKH